MQEPRNNKPRPLSTFHVPRSRFGFTLIEVLMVITLSVVLALAAGGLFYSTLIGSSRKNVESTLKDEGDYAASQMEYLLRNALAIVPAPGAPDATNRCQLGMSAITLQSIDTGITTLEVLDGKIASVSANNDIRNLTSNDVVLTNLQFNCARSTTTAGTYVEFSFDLSKESPSINNQNTITQNFRTSVSLRNY